MRKERRKKEKGVNYRRERSEVESKRRGEIKETNEKRENIEDDKRIE